MKNPISADAVSIPQDLRDAMYSAYDAMAEKRGQVDRLNEARAAIEADIAADRAALDEAKASYVDSFASTVTDPKDGPKAPQKARADMSEIGGRIYAAEQTLPDFQRAITEAEAELRQANAAYKTARQQAVNVLVRHSIAARREKSGLIDFAGFLSSGGMVDLNAALTLYFAPFFDGPSEMGQPFGETASPDRFFTYIGRFFRVPTADEVAAMRADFERGLWGDREPPAKVTMPDTPAPPKGALGVGVNFDMLGTR